MRGTEACRRRVQIECPVLTGSIKTGPTISGLDDLVRGTSPIVPGQEGRTVELSRFSMPEEIEPDAEQISRLLLTSASQRETRLTGREGHGPSQARVPSSRPGYDHHCGGHS